MKIKWRVTIGLILQCVLVIVLYGGIIMAQLRDNVEQDSNALNAKISEQTLLSFSYISDDIEGYLFNICRSENVTSAIMTRTNQKSSDVLLERFLYSLTESTDYIAGAYLADEENGRFYGYAQLNCDMTPDAVEKKYREGFFGTDKDTLWYSDEDGNVFIKREIYNGYPYKKIGYIIVNLSSPDFLALVGIDSSAQETLCIFSSDGQLIVDGSGSTVERSLLKQAYAEGVKQRETVVHAEFEDEPYDVYVHSNQGWSVMHLIRQRDKLDTYFTMNTSIRIIGVLMCVFSIILAWLISYSLLKNVNSMMEQIQLIGDGEAKKRIEISSHDEIGELADCFNQLFTKLDAVNERIIEERLEKENIRYELLNLQLRSVQAQIAPHFIGNLLGALNSYAAVGQTDKVEQLAVHASGYIRNNLKNADKKFNTLEEEYKTIDDYIALYQDIFGQPETYEAVFENEECRNMLVPSMLIQPMVENSLKYCSKNGQLNKTNIRLRAVHRGDRLDLHIEDTSSAFPDDVLAALDKLKTTGEDTQHKLGFGLTGTVRSLRLLYGDDFDFTVNQVEEYRKEIVVSLPANTESTNLLNP